ncbi:hypothetical protein BH18ACT13_BH18ACT13_02380 [soil metagenome]
MNTYELVMKRCGPNQGMSVLSVLEELEQTFHLLLHLLRRGVLKKRTVFPVHMIGLFLPLAVVKWHLTATSQDIRPLVRRLVPRNELVKVIYDDDRESPLIAGCGGKELEGFELTLNRLKSVVCNPAFTLSDFTNEAFCDERLCDSPTDVVESFDYASLDRVTTQAALAGFSELLVGDAFDKRLPCTP